jgi:hypothetical protein
MRAGHGAQGFSGTNRPVRVGTACIDGRGRACGTARSTKSRNHAWRGQNGATTRTKRIFSSMIFFSALEEDSWEEERPMELPENPKGLTGHPQPELSDPGRGSQTNPVGDLATWQRGLPTEAELALADSRTQRDPVITRSAVASCD